MKHNTHTPESAETLALQAVAFLASDDRHIERFVASSGLDPDMLRRNVGDSATLAGVLDYILGDDSLVIEFAAFAGVPPETPALARQSLPGFKNW